MGTTMKSSKQRVQKWVAAVVIGASLAGTIAVVPFTAAYAADKKDEKNAVSAKSAKTLKAAKDAIDAKKYQDGIAKLKEAEGIAGKTPYDQYIIDQLYAYAYSRTNNLADAEKSLEAVLNSQFVPQSEVADRTRTLMLINYQLKNYDKAIDFGQRAVKGGFANDDMYKFTSQAYFLKNDFKSVKSFTEPYVEMEVKNGRTPTEEILQILLNSCSKLNDDECVTKQLERLVTYHPKNEYWQNLLYSMFQAPSMNDKTLLNTFRLANEVDILKRPDDYTEMAQLAIEAGSPGEAQKILEKGFQKNVFPDARAQDKNKRLLASAQKAADADKATLAKSATDADAAATGDKDVAVGLAYLGYQQYDKAAELLSKGIAKGGVKNDAEAHLLLGIAQLKAGKKDDAMKTFKAVKGDANMERLANLWSLHAKQA